MISFPDLLMFIAALTAAYLLPGPDMALVLSTTAFKGPRTGIQTAIGLAISRTTHVALSALGLAALFHTHPGLFEGARWLGAAYLFFLAIKLLKAQGLSHPANAPQAESGWLAVRNGIMTNLLNPKALLFCALLLPQFIAVESPLPAQYLILGVILVGQGFCFDLVYVFAASRLMQKFAKANRVQKAAKLIFSGIFGLTAIRLAFNG